jgi:hypothetical protein
MNDIRGVIGPLLAVVLLGGCFGWQYDTTYAGVAFSRVRVERGLAIGVIRDDTVIGGRPCRRGWVHVRANGVPAGFTASRDIDLGRFSIPAGTWVFQDAGGTVTVCAFPKDTEVQGHLCRGGWGGSEGVQAAFYPDGALKQYFLARNSVIQGVPCKAGSLNESVELFENGRIRACVLSRDFRIGARTYPQGARVHFNQEGAIVD